MITLAGKVNRRREPPHLARFNVIAHTRPPCLSLEAHRPLAQHDAVSVPFHRASLVTRIE